MPTDEAVRIGLERWTTTWQCWRDQVNLAVEEGLRSGAHAHTSSVLSADTWQTGLHTRDRRNRLQRSCVLRRAGGGDAWRQLRVAPAGVPGAV